MSVWMVDFEHINVLVWAGLQREYAPHGTLNWYWGSPTRVGTLDYGTTAVVGQMLVRANTDSLKARYGDDDDLNNDLPLFETYSYRQPRFASWSRAEILKAIHCFEYQSCEVPDWRDTEAFAFCRSLEAGIVCSLPGYGTAPWGIDHTTMPWLEKKARAR